MLFYHVQIKERPYPSVNIREKASISKAGLEGGGGWSGVGRDKISTRGGGWDFNEAGGRDFRGQNALRKHSGSKWHPGWLIIDSNAAKIITVWDYKCTKN